MSNETPLKTLTSFHQTFYKSIRKKFSQRYQSWKSMLWTNFKYLEKEEERGRTKISFKSLC